MKAMVLKRQNMPLEPVELADPVPGPEQVLIAVTACGVCRTDLHVVDGDLTDPALPLIPGHEIVGTVVRTGPGVSDFLEGQRVGVPWLGHTCGVCAYCRGAMENLCDNALFTGYTLPGGYAELTTADRRYCFPIPEGYSDTEAAPLLCAGLIGFRSLVMAGEARNLGMYGFGAAAHILVQVAVHQGRSVFAFTRPGDSKGQEFAGRLGAVWAGDSTARPPEELDAAIIFAPVGNLVPAALRVVRKGGVVVCAGIHMSDIPGFPYELLWGERTVRSVANLTRRDGEEFLSLAPVIPVRNEVQVYALDRANEALSDLRSGRVQGAAVLSIHQRPGP
jgi:propanol-preferring alcohol dehydrogenase